MNIKLKNRGFTLIEMLVALAILSLIVAIGMSVYDGSKSKAQALIGLTKQLADANMIAKEDMGCFSTTVVGLFEQGGGAAGNSFLCKTAAPTLTRLYAPRQTEAATPGDIKFAKVAEDLTIGFRVIAPAGLGKRYVVDAKQVPVDIVKHALRECNGSGDTDAELATMAADAALGTFKCVGTTAGQTGTFTQQYAETR